MRTKAPVIQKNENIVFDRINGSMNVNDDTGDDDYLLFAFALSRN